MADILGFLKKAAPWTAQVLSVAAPGPIGMVAGIVAKAIGQPAATKPTPESIADSLSSLMQTDDGRIKLAQIEADVQAACNQLQIKTLDDLVEAQKIAAADRADARNMQVQTKTWIVPAIAGMFVAGFFVITILKLFHVIPASDPTTNDLLTTLRDGLIVILTYYFGSSKGSADKDVLLANSVPADSVKGK